MFWNFQSYQGFIVNPGYEIAAGLGIKYVEKNNNLKELVIKLNMAS